MRNTLRASASGEVAGRGRCILRCAALLKDSAKPVAHNHSQPSPMSAVPAAALALTLVLGAGPAVPSASALGLESVDILPSAIQTPEPLAGLAERSRKVNAEADKAFEQSETLKNLLAKSAENKDKNRKKIEEKYCYRQAELGVGDCGGLRFIPGMTENGKQKTPDWLSNLLGVEPQPETPESKMTLKDLFKDLD